MPSQIDPCDFVGRRFGNLVVVEPINSGARCSYRCLCDCGTEFVTVRHYLIRGAIKSCETCRWTRECTICGGSFVSQQYKLSCSEPCLAEYKRRKALESYYRRSAADPDLNRRNNAARAARLAQDPSRAALARLRELERSRRRRSAMTEEELEADRERLRVRYRENSEEILRARRERLLAKPAEVRARIYKRWLQNNRDYYAANRDRIREYRNKIVAADREGWNAYTRERHRARLQLRAQAELADLSAALDKKTNKE